MATLQRNACSLHFEATGVGLPILLTHGFAATSHMWRGQTEALGADNTVVRWDMRGHGRSASPPDAAVYSVDETVADMLAVLDHLGHERAIIAGHSLGGYMSLAFCLRHPERARALIPIDTGPGYKRDAPREEWNHMAEGLAVRLDHFGLDHLRQLSREMNPHEHRSATGLALAARGMLIQKSSEILDSLSKIQVPTLVIVGAKDRSYLAAGELMTKKIPNSEQVVIPNAGHAVNIHQPALFNAAISRFIENLD